MSGLVHEASRSWEDVFKLKGHNDRMLIDNIFVLALGTDNFELTVTSESVIGFLEGVKNNADESVRVLSNAE